MSQYLFKQKSIWLAFIASLSLLVVAYILFKFRCFAGSCGLNLLEGVIVPSFWGTLVLSLLLAFFFFFPEAVFKSWLKRIAWWYAIIILFATLSISPHASSILSAERSQVVLFLMIILAVITIPFAFIMRKRVGDQNLSYPDRPL